MGAPASGLSHPQLNHNGPVKPELFRSDGSAGSSLATFDSNALSGERLAASVDTCSTHCGNRRPEAHRVIQSRDADAQVFDRDSDRWPDWGCSFEVTPQLPSYKRVRAKTNFVVA
jgi:hypothetical protein